MASHIIASGTRVEIWVGTTPNEHFEAIKAIAGVAEIEGSTVSPVYRIVYDPRHDLPSLTAAVEALDI